MEILSTVEYLGYFWFFIILFLLISLVMISFTLVGIGNIGANGVDGKNIFMVTICLVVTGCFLYLFIDGIRSGPDVEYKAKVTDFNEVYKNGYIVIDQDGDLYTLKKMK